MERLTESQLVIAYKAGDEKALEVLLNRYKDKIYGYIFSKIRNEDIANDIFQDTFIKAIVTIKKGKYNEEGKFIQWIMRIAHNLVIDHFRLAKKRKTYSESTFGDESFSLFDIIPCENLNVEDSNIKKQIKKDVLALLETLPEEQKEVLHLRLFSGLSFKEIAEETGVSINTALGRMRYAIINIRKIIEEKNIILTS